MHMITLIIFLSCTKYAIDRRTDKLDFVTIISRLAPIICNLLP